MRVKCEVCQVVVTTKEFPTKACTCGAKEWLRVTGDNYENRRAIRIR